MKNSVQNASHICNIVMNTVFLLILKKGIWTQVGFTEHLLMFYGCVEYEFLIGLRGFMLELCLSVSMYSYNCYYYYSIESQMRDTLI